MKKNTGLWIDHNQAVMVNGINPDETEAIIRISSGVVRPDRFSGSTHASIARSPHTPVTEYGRARHFDNLLNRYYDQVILNLRNATSIVILGPGEAKYELQNRLAGQGRGEMLVVLKTAGEMTDEQIAAEIRQHFEMEHIVSPDNPDRCQ